MNKMRYSATEFGRNKPMKFRPSGTLKNNGKESPGRSSEDENFLLL